MPIRVLLGPQRLRPVLGDAVRDHGIEGPIAVVTAGWQEREAEVDELRDHLGHRVVNLRLYHRAEDVFEEDPELFRAYRARQEQLREVQALYRLRLSFAMQAARELLTREGDPALLEPEREAAIAAVRTLDRAHQERLEEAHRAFDAEQKPYVRPAVARHRRRLAQLLRPCAAFAVAGGHVAILLNRLQLFGLSTLIGERPVFAWSGGAMVLGERIVLFHDSPPQGRGDAEVLEAGLKLYQGVLPLPHARHRLTLDDRVRVSLLARRFGAQRCVAMDEGARLTWDGSAWHAQATRELGADGSVRAMDRPAA